MSRETSERSGAGLSAVLATMEVRWFVAVERPGGGIPGDVQAWFDGGPGGLPRGEGLIGLDGRDDLYLSLPDCLDLNIKLRAGQRLEVKRRRLEAGTVRWGDDVTGRAEQWAKWSFHLPERDENANPYEPADQTVPPGQWVVVRKQRQLRKFEVKPGDRLEPIAASSWPAEGCQLEITRLECLGSMWWSLALEAFGSADRVADILSLAVEQVPAVPDHPRLRADASYAYPVWLGAVLQQAS